MKRCCYLMSLVYMPFVVACMSAPVLEAPTSDPRVLAIHEGAVFADMHAHPSRFHRANVESITAEEVELYRRSTMDLVVANISSDMAYDGSYFNRDGTKVEKGKYRPEPGETYALSADRLSRLMKTFELGYAVHADTPDSVTDARRTNQVAIMPALEGADALEGQIQNLYKLHKNGLRLIQLVHFRNNELGHVQTWPYSPGGLTEFGREVVREANRLGLVIDMAHANAETQRDILATTVHPVIFSHGGVQRYTDHDRAVTDDQIRAIAENGGVVGIWPHGRHIATVAEMVDYIEHVIEVGGIDHAGIGSDLRGVSTYVKGFDHDAKFHAIASELLDRGYSDEDVGKVMGGNFFRVWREVSMFAGDFSVYELTIPQLQAAMDRGQITSQEAVRQYLARIDAFDKKGPKLNAMIHINPRAAEEAAELDRERETSGARGPLHGIPIVLKDNYDTHDMPTTGGSLALRGFVPERDGYQVRKLREAGVVIIGKTNLHELARGIETISSLGGQTLNPYDPRRNPGGSSGGTAVAVTANFAAVGMGSDTCGSIRIPAATTNLYGLRVTQGLSSRDGIIPLSHTQDVGGPLARSMVDLAIVLGITTGVDPADEQTTAATGHVPASYLDFLNPDALEGARLGVLTEYLEQSGPYAEVSDVIQQAVGLMGDNGADIIEIEVEGLEELRESTSVIDMEFKFDLNAYLEASQAPVESLAGILESGRFHPALEERFRRSEKAEQNSGEYLDRLERRERLAALLLAVMAKHDLDALVYPTLRVKPDFIGERQTGSLCHLAAHSGLPAITLPAGFTSDGLPVGIELLARPFEDGRLIELGFAWEQVARPRRPPGLTPSLVSAGVSAAAD